MVGNLPSVYLLKEDVQRVLGKAAVAVWSRPNLTSAA
jgi:hypothetical protein